MMNFADIAVFQLMATSIKQDFALTDPQLGLLLGPAGILFYVVVGIPLARLVDIYRRTFILGLGLVVTSGMTAIGGLTQGFGQFFGSRMFVGVGGSAHGPGTYSLLADYVRPKWLPWAFAFLQLGFILGGGLGGIVGGRDARPCRRLGPGAGRAAADPQLAMGADLDRHTGPDHRLLPLRPPRAAEARQGQ